MASSTLRNLWKLLSKVRPKRTNTLQIAKRSDLQFLEATSAHTKPSSFLQKRLQILCQARNFSFVFVRQFQTENRSSGAGGFAEVEGKGLETDESREERRKKMEVNTRRGAWILMGFAGLGLVTFLFRHGLAEKDEHGNVIEDEFSGAGPLQIFKRSYNALVGYYLYLREPSREKLLPDPIKPPYYQPKYTLVMEIKGVLVHPEWSYSTGWRFKKRPAVEYFLKQVGYPVFELVIYTNEGGMTGQPIIDSLDPNAHRNDVPPTVMYRLYRDTTKFENGHHVKDLSKLNRDLKKVIMVDWDPHAFALQPENALRVPCWEGEDSDTSLLDLAELLKTIAESDVEDVREIVQFYSQFDDPAKEFRHRKMLAEQSSVHQKEDNSPAKHYSGRLFGFRRHSP